MSNDADTTERLIILDDISTLEWIGFPLLDVSRFIRALVAACRRVSIYQLHTRLIHLKPTFFFSFI